MRPHGIGKYALVQMRRIEALNQEDQAEVRAAMKTLDDFGVLRYGNESPGDQFFVLKYKDKFTAPALRAYAESAMQASSLLWPMELIARRDSPYPEDAPITRDEDAQLRTDSAAARSLKIYAGEMFKEYQAALKVGNRIPD